ncbi:MAG: hypothetical protein ACR2QK_12390 [Acidimicrobiales bacterium]
MSKTLHGDEWAEPTDVPQAADRRIRLEAVRQLDTIDLADDDARIEALPSLGSVVTGGVK